MKSQQHIVGFSKLPVQKKNDFFFGQLGLCEDFFKIGDCEYNERALKTSKI